uniref:Uncharacterized protein n=1 Tax=Daucus carota subsp. sativus TaxID=79200 RepID=A0A162AF29_DAUCS
MGNSVEQVGCAKGETEKLSRGETRLDAAMSWTSNLVGKRVSLVVAAQADRKIELSFVALEADMGSFAALAFARHSHYSTPFLRAADTEFGRKKNGLFILSI